MKLPTVLLLLIIQTRHFRNNIPEKMAGTRELKLPGDGDFVDHEETTIYTKTN